MEEEVKKLIESVQKNITEQGFRISGQGMIANNTEQMIEKLDKIQKFLYFIEKRQNEMFEYIKSKGI